MFKRSDLVSEDVKAVTNAQKAQILMNALPYIKKYSGKTVVVKYGGNAMINEDLKRSVMGDIVLLNLIGVKVVLVHGGGPHIKSALDQLGIESKFINGLRVTDEATMKVVQMVLAGQVNKDLVNRHLAPSAASYRSLRHRRPDDQGPQTERRTGLRRAHYRRATSSIIQDNLDKGYIPVISTIGTDTDGQAYNINADTAAAQIAGALNAECMLSMTNIDGVLKDPSDPDSLLTEITLEQSRQLEQDGIIAGGMIPKVQCCTDAIKAGVKRVFIINGTVPHAILIEMLTEEGLGTMFVGHYSLGK